ncbi:hypothetical protein HPP92_015949 [Vanilla planifolia]|uniref:Pentatricopeptide repeat-containing protein n=1 Tax=Vanilla planifolia TaxID=51239 RepID=A0A835QSK2_VANPL|nr:hypothetical protein HPP92_015949 [Vanilla planifolia]
MSGGQPLPWLTLLQRCRSLVHLEQIHALCAKVGADGCNLFAGKLILLASVTVADSLDYARRVLDDFPSPDVFMFNTLIRGLAESDQPYLSLVTYLHMKRRLLAPDSFSFTFLLKAVANSRCLSAGAQLHSDAIRHGLDVHLYVGTTMVFEELPQPNVVAWNAVVTACFRCGDMAGAVALCTREALKKLEEIMSRLRIEGEDLARVETIGESCRKQSTKFEFSSIMGRGIIAKKSCWKFKKENLKMFTAYRSN